MDENIPADVEVNVSTTFELPSTGIEIQIELVSTISPEESTMSLTADVGGEDTALWIGLDDLEALVKEMKRIKRTHGFRAE